MAKREKFIDYDARREPKTDRWCCCCQKDIKADQAARIVFVSEFPMAIHPDDVDPMDWSVKKMLIGNDCAKKLGLEFSVAEAA